MRLSTELQVAERTGSGAFLSATFQAIRRSGNRYSQPAFAYVARIPAD
jgi:hypothetical protein